MKNKQKIELFYRQQIEEALQQLKTGLGPFVLKTYRQNGCEPSAKINETLKTTPGFNAISPKASDLDILAQLDTQKLLKLIKLDWDQQFKKAGLDDLGHGYIYELIGYRNLWAHEQPLEQDDFHRVADSIHRLLRLIKANKAADEVEHIIEEMRKKRNSTRGKTIIVEINGSRFKETSLERIYQLILVYLYQRKCLAKLELPISTSKERFLLANEPKHPNGNPFLMPVHFEGYFLEAHNNRSQALSNLSKLSEMCGFQLIIIQS